MDKKEMKWLEQLIADRIEMILDRDLHEKHSCDSIAERAEQIFVKLSAEDRGCVDRYIDQLMSAASVREDLLYRSGVSDGIRMMRFFYQDNAGLINCI